MKKAEKKMIFKKLDEDDILEIIIKHFQDDELYDFIRAKACLFGESGKNLRFVGVFSNNESEPIQCDLEKLDKKMEFNGDHSFLKKHPEFYIDEKKIKGQELK